jgi:hypothetical protein
LFSGSRLYRKGMNQEAIEVDLKQSR